MSGAEHAQGREGIKAAPRLSAEGLRFTLATAYRYADIALRDGCDPESVCLEIWDQIQGLVITYIYGADSAALRDQELIHYRELSRDLVGELAAIVDLLNGSGKPGQLVKQAKTQAELALGGYAEKLAGTWIISFERRREEAAEADKVNETSARDEPQTLIETVDGGEFGVLESPAVVARRLSSAPEQLVLFELALGDGPIWLGPGHVSAVRPYEKGGDDDEGA